MKSTTSIADRIAELEAELKATKELQRMELDMLRETVTPVYAYDIRPVEDSFDRIYDESVTKFRLSGVCTNQEAVDAVGGKTFTGSMVYMFNWASGRVIGAFGGGSIFIGGRNHERDSAEVLATMDKLSSFIVANPDGGDITSIIEEHRASIA